MAFSFFFMTGVSPITLNDVTSGFNIATNISLDSDVNEMVGFTKRLGGQVLHYNNVEMQDLTSVILS